jgi:hypothetical protein
MCSKCLWVFLAGAAAMHTFSHIVLGYSPLLPLNMWGIALTQNLNYAVIAGSALLTGLFLFLARGYSCECKVR